MQGWVAEVEWELEQVALELVASEQVASVAWEVSEVSAGWSEALSWAAWTWPFSS